LRLLGLARGGVDYAQWAAATFGSDATNPAIGGETADPGHKGVANIVAYALAPDLSAAPAQFLPRIAFDAGRVGLVFTRSTLAANATIVLQGADAVDGPWEDLARSTNGNRFDPIVAGVTVNESIVGGVSDVQITDLTRVDDPQHTQRFLRLRITRN
jgi:hypothetical protein